VWLDAKYQEMGYGNYGLYKIGKEADDILGDIQYISPFDIGKNTVDKIFTVEQDIVNGAPFLPVMTTGTGVMYTTKNWTNFPTTDTTKYDYRVEVTVAYAQGNFVQTLMNLKPANS
jgi:peptide/nickel transport system substrate-binding protein